VIPHAKPPSVLNAATLPSQKLRESSPRPMEERSQMSQKFRKLMGNEEEGRFCGMLVKSAQDSMIVCDQSLNICFHNRAFLKLFGHTNGSYKNFSLLDFVPSLDQTDAKRAFDQLAYGKAWQLVSHLRTSKSDTLQG